MVGISKTSWEDAGKKAVEVASKSLRDLRVAEVIKTDMKVENGKVTALPHAGIAVVQVRGLRPLWRRRERKTIGVRR